MSNRKVCQYCFREFNEDKYRRTAEHIIPKGIIDLYPEHYISFTDGKEFVDNRGMTIADVCKYCNGTLLSPLDSYGKSLIKNQFFERIPIEELDNTFIKTFDYTKLSRWLLKILFNARRAKNLDCSWFDNAHGYMLYGLCVENISFSIFAGVHINTTPMPEETYANLPMQIHEEPMLLGNSLGIVSLGIDPYVNSIKVPMAAHTYCIRLGTAVFYCILWMTTADIAIKISYNEIFEKKFNFKRVFLPSNVEYHLKCVSAHSNTTLGYNHLLSASGQAQDKKIIKSRLGGRDPAKVQKLFNSLMPSVEMEKGRVLVEAAKFPKNKRILRKYEMLFDSSKKEPTQ